METTNREENKRKISSIIAEIREEDFVLLEEKATLAGDIGLDSMGFLELAIQIQRTFGTVIPNEEWKSIASIGDLLNIIEKKQKKDE